MLFYFDESGDFAFPSNSFDAYTQAVLICPDVLQSSIDQFVGAKMQEFGCHELHCSEMDPNQVLEISEFIGSKPFELLVNVTDSHLASLGQIGEFRLAQAAKIEKGLSKYRRESTKALGAPVEEIEQFMLRQIKRAGLSSQISHPEYVQAHLLLELIPAALQKAIFFFAGREWEEDFSDFSFILDGKLPAKLAAGEKYLEEMIVPLVGSRDAALDLPEEWNEDPQHRFVERFERHNVRIRGKEADAGIDVGGIFEGNFSFVESENSPGVQLADTVASVVRQAIIRPDDEVVQQSYDALRGKLRGLSGRCLLIRRFGIHAQPTPDQLDRYAPLYGPSRS